ncbi:MAG: AtpZ/AtpI family protein [Rhodospirillaceae bacterium]|nr:AtpZ/AtpI family protein [Rhodospirillaceae bacterium]
MAQSKRPSSLLQFDVKLRVAQDRHEKKRAGRRGKQDIEGRTDRGQGIGLALRIGTELVAGLVVGVVIGLAFDWWLGTKPWFMIVFFFLGAAAGIVNVFRTVNGLGHAVGYASSKGAEDSASGDGKRERG